MGLGFKKFNFRKLKDIVGIWFKYVEVWSKIIHFVKSLNKDSSNWFAEDGERGVDKKTDKSLDKHLSVDAVAEFANA